MAQGQAAVAFAEHAFGGVDILFCCEGEGKTMAAPSRTTRSTSPSPDRNRRIGKSWLTELCQ